MRATRSAGHGLPGAADAGHEAGAETGELAERRGAVAELGAQLRVLNEAAVRTEVDPDVLRKAAADVAALVDTLGAQQREASTPPAVDDLRDGRRMYNPVIGPGHPTAPPVEWEIDGKRVEGRCTLGLVYEGPPTSAHGGMSALLLDQMFGHAAAAAHNVGVTTNLEVRYRKPVPLGVPLRIWAEAVDVDGQRTTIEGAIATAAEPDVALVEGNARFLSLNEEQAKRMLPDLFTRQDNGNGTRA